MNSNYMAGRFGRENGTRTGSREWEKMSLEGQVVVLQLGPKQRAQSERKKKSIAVIYLLPSRALLFAPPRQSRTTESDAEGRATRQRQPNCAARQMYERRRRRRQTKAFWSLLAAGETSPSISERGDGQHQMLRNRTKRFTCSWT